METANEAANVTVQITWPLVMPSPGRIGPFLRALTDTGHRIKSVTSESHRYGLGLMATRTWTIRATR